MLDFLSNIFGLLWRWILYTVLVPILIYVFMQRIAWHMGLRSYFDQYIEMVIDWIRDAFRD